MKFVKWDGQYSIDDSQPSSIHADNEFEDNEYDQQFDQRFQDNNECSSEYENKLAKQYLKNTNLRIPRIKKTIKKIDIKNKWF